MWASLMLFFHSQESAVLGEHIWTDADSSGHSCCMPDNECSVRCNLMSVNVLALQGLARTFKGRGGGLFGN